MKNVRAGLPAFLASVTSLDEARLALAGGADLIDCKQPADGALGALSAAVVNSIVGDIGGRALVSATIGDLEDDADRIVMATAAMASTGVDFVKIGFFGGVAQRDTARLIAGANLGRARPVAVLMADRQLDLGLIPFLARSGFAAVMIDTSDKTVGSLTKLKSAAELQAFVDAAASNGIASGLAGSLRQVDVPLLAALSPDILGFRGALCEGGRTGTFDPARVRAIRVEIDRCFSPQARSVA